jgi:MFS family permease
VVRTHGRQLFGGTFAAIACFAIFYLATAFALGYGTTKLGFARQDFLGVQLVAILFMAAGIILSGYWADRTSPARVLGIGCAAMLAASFLTKPWLGSGDLFLTGAYLSMLLFVMGLVYGPLGAWLPGLFPARVRYTGASICFNGAGILGGALAPNIALKLSERGLEYVGYYLAIIALFSLFGRSLLRTRQVAS